MKSKQRKLKEVKRINKYVSFLEGNHEWDYIYIVDLLRFKLKMTRKLFEKEGHSVAETNNEIINQILEVEQLLQKVIDDKYYEPFQKEIETRYGKSKLKFGKMKNGLRELTVKWDLPEEKRNEAITEQLRLGELATQMQKDDLKKAFDLMAENIWNWWD
jgi:competence CoiA-like predicted nuclease